MTCKMKLSGAQCLHRLNHTILCTNFACATARKWRQKKPSMKKTIAITAVTVLDTSDITLLNLEQA
jgi:hypothetical protein